MGFRRTEIEGYRDLARNLVSITCLGLSGQNTTTTENGMISFFFIFLKKKELKEFQSRGVSKSKYGFVLFLCLL